MKADNGAALSVPVYFKSVKKRKYVKKSINQNKPTKQKEKKKVSSGGSRTPDLQRVR